MKWRRASSLRPNVGALGALLLMFSNGCLLCGQVGIDNDAGGGGGSGSGGGGSGGGGAGGKAGATTTTSATAGGAGGAPSSCGKLVLSGNPITYTPTPSEHESYPSLVPANEDGSLVSVVLSHVPLPFDALDPGGVASVTFSPWESWPASLGPYFEACSFGMGFAAAPAMPAGQPRYSVLQYVPTGSFPSDMSFSTILAANTSTESCAAAAMWDSWEPAWPVALARGSSSHLAAYQLDYGSGPTMDLAFIKADSHIVSFHKDVACAKAAFPAAVVPTAGGFLVATAAGKPFGTCAGSEGLPGPAGDLQVMRVHEATEDITLSASIEGSDRLLQIALAKRPTGAWLVWQRSSENAEDYFPIQAVPLGELGEVAGPDVSITKGGVSEGPLAAAALDQRLVVAWAGLASDSSPIRLDLFDEAGTFLSGTSLDVAPSSLYGAPLSLLASPEGDAVLLAWSDRDASARATVRVARFSCASGP